ncbi:MAG: two-component sensor histidine kinase [Candidatus Eisenbacteria bacterium]|nr:two-component sensor histidine kinase [Candidatus Latescibacterota bacterium]MBD3301572.1 two-component sensor histidine kinase [Candidatus Eisenbacteria bacterium]
MALSRSNLPAILRAYLFLGGFILVAITVIVSVEWTRRVKSDARNVSELFAEFCAVTTFSAIETPELRDVFDRVIKPANFPMILTDREGRPFVWRGIENVSDTLDVSTLAAVDPEDPPPGPIAELIRTVERFDRDNVPIPIRRPGESSIFGYVHYGEPSMVKQLRWIPIVQVLALFFFLGLGTIGYRSIKTSEQRSIWIGLAKETAHQLGTPISSLLGWVELLGERGESARTGDAKIQIDEPFFREVVDEMENDGERLQKVAMRFGQVGSLPRLEPQDLAPIVSEAVRYYRRRIPNLRKDVEIRERYDLVPPVNVNKELIEWVVENVLKNAIDATTQKHGTIEVELARRPETECVEVRVTDQGKGMTPREVRRVFSPGFTTKQRGWGLGLTLAKRIVEDYHGGKIWVERSQPGKGSTFVISFPV